MINCTSILHFKADFFVQTVSFYSGGSISKLWQTKIVFFFFFFFFVGILSWLADKLHFILSYEAGFYKPTALKVHPPFCRITAYATMPG